MKKTMQAVCVVWNGDQRKLEQREVPVPTVRPGWILGKVRACGICFSDLPYDTSPRRWPKPAGKEGYLIEGHEFSFDIVEVGEGVNHGFKPGARAVADSTIFCGSCRECLRGNHHLCVDAHVFGVSPQNEAWIEQGAYAEYVLVPERSAYLLPDSVSYVQAALAEPIGVSLHGFSQGHMRIGETAVVVSCGQIGLGIVMFLRSQGYSVIAVNRGRHRLQSAIAMGATGLCLDDMDCNEAARQIKGLTGGGADVVYECSPGNSEMVNLAVNAVRRGGRIVAQGNTVKMIDFPWSHMVANEISIQGVKAYPGPRSIPTIISGISSGALNVDQFITGTCRLDETVGKMQALRSGELKVNKLVVLPNG